MTAIHDLSGLQLAADPVANCWDPTSGDDLCKYVYGLTHNSWLATASNWLIAKPLAVLGLLLLGLVARLVLHRLTDRLSARATAGTVPSVLQRMPGGDMLLEVSAVATERRAQRAATMASLLKSITTGIIFTIVLFMAVAELGYDIGPLVASAGILGVALGFGAQSLVKDFLSGIFMIVEDQYGVGDVIDAGEATGTVEGVSLRITRLRDVNGTVWYVRNGEVLRIGNMSQNWARTVLDIPIAYSENLANVRAILQQEADALWNDPAYRPVILEEPEVWGVERMDVDGLVVRVVLKTAPLEQWKVAREMRERIKTRFDAAGIETPSLERMFWQQRSPAGDDQAR